MYIGLDAFSDAFIHMKKIPMICGHGHQGVILSQACVLEIQAQKI
jgi:hypothetical protein